MSETSRAAAAPEFRHRAPADRQAASAAAGRVRAKLRRLWRMPLAEIAGRSRQEASKWIDRATAAERDLDPRALLQERAPALAQPDAALEMLRTCAVSRFFAGAEDPAALAAALPQHKDNVLASAASALQGRFDLLGYRNLWFGDPIDWHADPVWHRRAPRVHWTRVRPLDPASVGDSKIVWELNRHQWMVRLAQAYAFTEDERYAEACMRSLDSWIDANPYGVGVNWSSSLEAAYRVMSWSWTLLLLRRSDALTGDRFQKILASVWLHANHVARYLSHYFSPNTHLTGEALGLFYAGTVFQEFADAPRWREIGAEVLVEQSRSQICSDGVHVERSTCYHRYTAETYLQFVLLARRNNVPVPPDMMDRLSSVMDFLLAVRLPDGSLPEIGDADGGQLMPLVERSQCDPRGVLAVAAAMLQRGDLAWAADGRVPDVPWLMGQEGARQFDEVRPAPPAGSGSRLFPSGGYVAMRSGWELDAHHAIVDVGPLGCSHSAGHGHADLLSIQCSVFGQPCLVDPGTYCYTPEREWRNFFRGTAAHNTVTIDGRDQAEPDGPFAWRTRPRVQLRKWRSDDRIDFVDAEHDGYASLHNPVRHRRRVLFVKPDYWVVVDDVCGADGGGSDVHRIDLGFQFAPIPVSLDRQPWAHARLNGGHALWIRSFSSSQSRIEIKTGERDSVRGWISPVYGQRTPAPHLVYRCETALPWRSVTVLMPSRATAAAGRSNPPVIEPLFDDGNLPIGLELADRRESIFVDESDVYLHLEP